MSSLSLYTGIIVEAARETSCQDISEIKPDQPGVHQAEGINPVCGDRVTWYFRMKGDRIETIRYNVTGCLMSKASASFLARFLEKRTISEAQKIYDELLPLTGPPEENKPVVLPDEQEIKENPWKALAQIRDYPARRKCVTMAWDSFFRALKKASE